MCPKKRPVAVTKKGKKRQKLSCVKLAISWDHPRQGRPQTFCTRGRIREVVIYFKFHKNRLRGLGAVLGRKSPSPIDKAHRYNSLYYRTSCDYEAYLDNHGLYSSTSCCISHGPKSMGEGDFRPSTAWRPLDRFSWNLKYITTSRMQNFRGLCRRGWSGQIASLTHESFSPFFRFFATPTGRIFGHIPTLNTSLYVVSAKVVPFRGQKD